MSIPTTESLTDLREQFLKERRLAGRSPKTLDNLQTALSSFARGARGEWRLTRSQLVDYLAQYQQTHQSATAHLHQQLLNQFYNWLVDSERLTANPLKGVPLPTVRVTPSKKAIANDEVERFLDYLRPAGYGTPAQHVAFARTGGRAWRTFRNWTMVSTCYLAALRAGETRNLRWRNVDFDRSVFNLEVSKTGAKQVPFVSRLREVLLLWRSVAPTLNPDAFVFPAERTQDRPLSKFAFYTTVVEAAKQGGFPPITTHTFRHSLLTHAAEQGVPLLILQQQAGHRSARTTERYIRINPSITQEAMEKVFA